MGLRRLGAGLRRLARAERGQSLVLFIFALGALLGLVSLTVDVGLVFVERREAQGAADAAALAGAQELPDSSAAVAAALQWAENNGFVDGVDGTTVSVTTPYQGDANSIRVEITREMTGVLAGAVGVDEFEVHASAVAARDASAGYAIFGANDSCNTRSVEFTGGSFAVYGNVHSNGKLKMTGGSVFIDGTASYVCSAQTGGGSQVITGGLVQVSEPLDWPIYFEYADFGPCTFQSSGDIHINTSTPEYWLNDDPASGVLKPGLYCADGDIHLSGASFSGQVTFIAHGNIHFSSSSLDFKPYVNDVVAFSDDASGSAIQVSASSLVWWGILMATEGEIVMSGSTASTAGGGIYGDKVDLNGGSYYVVGDGGSSLGSPHLIE